MADDIEKAEEAEIPKGQTITLWTAKPGKILEAKRRFYFVGGQDMELNDIIQVGIADNLTRVVTKNGKIYVIYHTNLLGIEITPPPKSNPLLGG